MTQSTPTPAQLRNRRWLATHTGTVAAVTGAAFSVLAAVIAWVAFRTAATATLGAAAAGAALGALIGVGVSRDYDDERPARRRSPSSKLILGVSVLVLIGLRAWRMAT